MKKLHYCGVMGSGYGWGTCNTNLSAALSKHFTVLTPPPGVVQLDAPAFIPIANNNLEPSGSWRGTKNIGYTFFEYPLGLDAYENSKLYDLIFCGSTWCQERLAERGITNTKVLIQGVDHKIFRTKYVIGEINRFTVFSGGKFEYRKGQDLVISAFRMLLGMIPDAVLVCNWFNPWPELLRSMQESKHFRYEPIQLNQTQPEYFAKLLEINGIPKKNFTILPMMDQDLLAYYMNRTHVGLFPNRCEGGTNLVLMEYMACGKPVVATLGTGHSDVLNSNIASVVYGSNDCQNWTVVEPEELAGRLKNMADIPILRQSLGIAGQNAIARFTWSRAAETVADGLACFY